MPANPILILSGGLDSTVLLWKLKPNVTCLTFDYGQRHGKEIFQAGLLCAQAGAKWKLVDLSTLSGFLSKGSLSGPDPTPEGHYTQSNMASTIVPNRNMIMLSIAVGHAISVGAAEVYYAAHAGDHAIYPDCREDFVRCFEVACFEGNGPGAPQIIAPFIHMSKANIVLRGLNLNVPFEKTWSCYRGEALACGRCGTCVERLEAFSLNNATDPLPYADREYWKSAVKEGASPNGGPNTQGMGDLPPSEREF